MLLVGGSSRIPWVKKQLEDFFEGTDAEIVDDDSFVDKDLAVAKGAAIMAGML